MQNIRQYFSLNTSYKISKNLFRSINVEDIRNSTEKQFKWDLRMSRMLRIRLQHIVIGQSFGNWEAVVTIGGFRKRHFQPNNSERNKATQNRTITIDKETNK